VFAVLDSVSRNFLLSAQVISPYRSEIVWALSTARFLRNCWNVSAILKLSTPGCA
jgi:hypothetical protein